MHVTHRLSLAISLLLATSLNANAADWFVAPTGADANPGTVDAPFASIQKATDSMRPGDTCFLRAGRYHETVTLADARATAEAPLVFTAHADEQVTLDGSVPIASAWTNHRGNIYKTKLDRPVWQLFVDGRSLCSARWPNGNWNDGSVWDKEKSMAWPEKEGSQFGRHVNGELADFDFSLQGAIVIVNAGSFKTYKSRVLEHRIGDDHYTYDTNGVRVHFSYQGKPELHGYFLEGKLGLLDTEGEWFFDPDDSMLYLWAPGGANPGDLEVRGKTLSYAFDVSDSSHLQVRGLDFFGTTFKFDGCDHVTVEDCDLLYPSYSKRMLGDLDPMDVTRLTVRGEFEPAYNTVRNCTFEYMDGPAIEMNGLGNRFENCGIHDVDISCTHAGGFTLNMINAPELVFRRNTVHTTGASELFKAGVRNLIELNDLSRSGFLQNDGSMVQISVKQQDRSITRYNWVHDSGKQGLRFDNMNVPNSPWGENGRLHHNVAWNTQRIFVKGDKHFLHNNLSFDNLKNDLIISNNVAINGLNHETITRNNIAGTLSGDINKPASESPVPGFVDHNWTSDVTGRDIRTQLRDPDNLDFRPRAGSDLIDAGLVVPGIDHEYLGAAPDIGPYEFGDSHYRIPGRKAPQASRPVPPDGADGVKTDADLMWLEAYRAETHDVYFGTDRQAVARADRQSKEFHGSRANNIFDPGRLMSGRTYYWRIDAVDTSGIVHPGTVWSFHLP